LSRKYKFKRIIFAFFLLFYVCFYLKGISNAAAKLNDFYKMRVEVRVLDIDQKTSYASIELLIRLGPLPQEFNETGILVQILGGGYVTLFCRYTTSDSYGKYFEGNSSSSWYLFGAGELFPFDYYYIEFRITSLIDADFKIDEATPIFYGPKQKSLCDTWETTQIINELPYHTYENEESVLIILAKRTPIAPSLAFVLPIILCYYFLGATLFLDPKLKMQEILTVYLSLFIFVPSFFIGIQEFLPYRSLLSIPEILLTNLITSIGLFGFFTMLSEYREAVMIKNFKLPLQWFGIIFALLFFIGYYLFLLLPFLIRLPSIEIILVFLFVVPSYLVSVIGFILRLRKQKAK